MFHAMELVVPGGKASANELFPLETEAFTRSALSMKMFCLFLRPELFLQPFLLAEASQWTSPQLLIFTKLVGMKLFLRLPPLHQTRLKQARGRDTGRCTRTL